MRKLALAPVIALLALTACGEDQTAEAPAEKTPPPVAAAPPADTERPTASTPPATTSETTTATNEAKPAAPPTADAAPPPAGKEAVSGSSGDTQVAATTPATASVSDIKPYTGRTYAAGPVSLQLNEDNTFVLTETGTSNKVQGKYAFENGVITFSQPTGDVGTAKFPIKCRMEGASADSFSLADTGGSCQRFHNLTFKPKAG